MTGVAAAEGEQPDPARTPAPGPPPHAPGATPESADGGDSLPAGGTPPFPAGSVYAGWGPSHFSELWYTFDHLDQEPTWAWTAADRKLADAMSSYWVNFAATGNPNGARLPEWPQFTTTTPSVLILDDPIAQGDVANLKSLQVFDAVYDQVRGAKFGEAGK